MDKITTKSVARGFAEIDEEFVLVEEPTTRIVFKAQSHDKKGIRGHLIRYKVNTQGSVDEIIPVDFKKLRANEGIEIKLCSEAVETLYDKLGKLRQLQKEESIYYGENEFYIIDSNGLTITDKNKNMLICKLLEADLGEEFWEQLKQSDSDLTTKLAHNELQSNRKATLDEFEVMLNNESLKEDDWQNFFEKNTWIFGCGLCCRILRIKQSQPNYGGSELTGRGGQHGDFLAHTVANAKFTCLIEIKKPTTQLLQKNKYRNHAWNISDELSGAISQVQVSCREWEINGSRTDHNREHLKDIYTVAPKGIVVAGNTNQLEIDNKIEAIDRTNSFECFRRGIHNPEIITYDELYERAKFIVNGC